MIPASRLRKQIHGRLFRTPVRVTHLPGNSEYLDASKRLFKVGEVFESTDRQLAGKYFKLSGYQMSNGFKKESATESSTWTHPTL